MMILYYKSKFDSGTIALVLTSSITIDITLYWIFYAIGDLETRFIGFERCLKFTTVMQEE